MEVEVVWSTIVVVAVADVVVVEIDVVVEADVLDGVVVIFTVVVVGTVEDVVGFSVVVIDTEDGEDVVVEGLAAPHSTLSGQSQ